MNVMTANNLETALKDTTRELREKLGEANIGHLNLSIDIVGPTNRDTIKITYQAYLDHKDTVRGGNLQAVIAECLRRMGWTEQNGALCLPRVE